MVCSKFNPELVVGNIFFKEPDFRKLVVKMVFYNNSKLDITNQKEHDIKSCFLNWINHISDSYANAIFLFD